MGIHFTKLSWLRDVGGSWGVGVPVIPLRWAAYNAHPNLASACFSSYMNWALGFCTFAHEYTDTCLYTREGLLKFYL